MPHYQLISFKTCPWVQRAAIVLREKGVPFEFVHIDTGNRPGWFAAISPHGKVPVLRIDGGTALFESNAIAEYLDETTSPRLHPEDPLQRARNRAWTDWLPTFAALLGAVSNAQDEAAHAQAVKKLGPAFAKLEQALGERDSSGRAGSAGAGEGGGPWFNGARYSLVDAAYAPFLQRWTLMERFAGGPSLLARHPALAGWAAALVARASTHSFAPPEFEALYRANLQGRGNWAVSRAPVAA